MRLAVRKVFGVGGRGGSPVFFVGVLRPLSWVFLILRRSDADAVCERGTFFVPFGVVVRFLLDVGVLVDFGVFGVLGVDGTTTPAEALVISPLYLSSNVFIFIFLTLSGIR